MIEDWLASGVFDSLAATNRVIAFDRPGFGHSRRPRNVVWTPAAEARAIASALSLLGAALKDGMEKQIFAPAPVSSGWMVIFPFEMTLRPSRIRAAAADAAVMVPAAASMAPRLPELKMPVTVIAGSGDMVVPPSEQSERLSRELRRSRLIMVEGAGHMVHHTAAGRIASEIRTAAAGVQVEKAAADHPG